MLLMNIERDCNLVIYCIWEIHCFNLWLGFCGEKLIMGAMLNSRWAKDVSPLHVMG